MRDNENVKPKRVIINISGRVQGVGFRPFVYRLAKKYSITGNVLNDLYGVTIDAEGDENDLNDFIKFLDSEKPPMALITAKTVRFLNPAFCNDFKIIESSKTTKTKNKNNAGDFNLIASPDIATCDKCLKEFLNPSDRRYLYPFINCTDCGPRFTITKELPYDRASTAMDKFKMCPVCKNEYEDPSNRRFHAEPNGCFICGPEIEFIGSFGQIDRTAVTTQGNGRPANLHGLINGVKVKIKGFDAFKAAAQILKSGGILCVKGIGGFHLMADATNDNAVKLLRARKNRPKKPFAVMFRDIIEASKYVFMEDISSSLLLLKERPIVLLKDKGFLSYFVNQGTKHTGVFMPYAPIHYIIFKLFNKPLITTSANFGGEPIAKDNDEAVYKLKSVADGFLIHNRDIYRRCDDSVLKVIKANDIDEVKYIDKSSYIFIRRSRGYVPDPIALPFRLRRNVLAAGAYLKNTFAIAHYENSDNGENGNGNGNPNTKENGAVILSQHNGDLDNISSFVNFTENIKYFESFYNFKPDVIVCDSHPDYENTRWAKKLAEETGAKCLSLQHHRAHIISCMAENGLGLEEDVLGIAFDGTGYGDDGTIWGGEFFKGNYVNLKRVGSLKKFRLLGGDRAVKSPQRVLLSLLFNIFFEKENEDYDFNVSANNYTDKQGVRYDKNIIVNLAGFSAENVKIFFKMWKRGINSPHTSSCGRIFDAVSCLCGFKGDISYEGEAAVYLEDLCGSEKLDNESGGASNSRDFFEYNIDYSKTEDLFIINYDPMLFQIIQIITVNYKSGADVMLYRSIAERFINTLALIINDIALRIGCKNICMSGGVFQNTFLLEKSINVLKKNGFSVFFNKKTPLNDGGISFGQAVYGGLANI